MFERTTDRARRVLLLSHEEARVLGHDFIGDEHLLLGHITVSPASLRCALTRCGCRCDAEIKAD